MSSPDIQPPSSVRRILIVRLGAMGDVIHTLPAAAALRRAYPEAEITWAVEPVWSVLLEGNPDVDHVERLPLKRWRRNLGGASWREFRGALARLRERRFDLAVDFQGLIKSAVLAKLSGARSIWGFDRKSLREPLARLFYDFTAPARAAHVVDRNLELAEAATGARSAGEAQFPLPAGEISPDLPEGDFLLASPLAGWRSKQWPPERFAELAGMAWGERRLPLVIDCAPADAEYGRAIVEQAPPGTCRLHVSTLPQLIGASRRAAAVIGVDSGPLHLAAALGIPGVALFGPTDPERNGPYGHSFHVLRHSAAATTYKRERDWSPAMSALSAQQVWRALSEVLEPQRTPPELVHSTTHKTI